MRSSLLAVSVLVLAACSGAEAPSEPAVETWSAPDPGILPGSDFAGVGGTGGSVWGLSQHSGEESYRFSAEAGVLSIERIGPEPWGQVAQRIDARPFVGKTLEFSADVAGEFEEDPHRQVQETGIGARVMGYPPGLPTIAGRHIMAIGDGEPRIGPGRHEWTRQTLRLEVPEGATDVEVSIRLGMHGTLRVRGPSLTASGNPDAEE